MSTLRTESLSVAVNRHTLVQGLSMTLSGGECWALLGANGAGKTSLLHTLAGLRKPAGGAVSLDGRALEAWPRRALARGVGVLLQDELEDFWGSTLEYVMLGHYAHNGAARDSAASTAEAAARHALAALDLAARLHQDYRTLSGGERQRARIAQLAVQDPAIWLLDEPLNHLDLRHQLVVMQLAKERAAAGRAVLMSLHEPVWARRACEHALLLYDAGRFSVGAAHDVLTQNHLEAAYGCRLEAVADLRFFLPLSP